MAHNRSSERKKWILDNAPTIARYCVERYDRDHRVVLSIRHEHAYEYLLVRIQNGMGRVVVMAPFDAPIIVYEFESLIEATKFMFNQAIIDIGPDDEFEGFVEVESF